MKRLHYFNKYILELLVYYFVVTIIKLFPSYIAYVYKYADRSRIIVYNYWYRHKQDNFKQYLGFGSKEVRFMDENIHKHFYVFMQNKPEVFGFLKTDEHISKLKYLFWYNAVWMWLDDLKLVNGVNYQLYREAINECTAMSKVFKLYNHVFSHAYVKDIQQNTVVQPCFMDRLMYISKNQTTNYMRHKLYKLDNILCVKGKYGYVYDQVSNRYIISFNKPLLRGYYE